MSKEIQKHSASHDLFNRIHSITADAAFVKKIAQVYDDRFEVVGRSPRDSADVANQRCGNWYCDPSVSAYDQSY